MVRHRVSERERQTSRRDNTNVVRHRVSERERQRDMEKDGWGRENERSGDRLRAKYELVGKCKISKETERDGKRVNSVLAWSTN